jgi:hypothetical protein
MHVVPCNAPLGTIDPAPLTSLPIHMGTDGDRMTAFWSNDDQYLVRVEGEAGTTWYRIEAEPSMPTTNEDARITIGGNDGYLTEWLGQDFTLLAGSIAAAAMAPKGVAALAPGDPHGDIAARYALVPEAAYLIRPDGHVAARFLVATSERIKAALRRARGKSQLGQEAMGQGALGEKV